MKKYLVLLFYIISLYVIIESKPYANTIPVRVPESALFHGRGQNMRYLSDISDDYEDSAEPYINSIGNGRKNKNNVTITSMDTKKGKWSEEDEEKSQREVSESEINSIGNGRGNVNNVVINRTHHRRHKKKLINN